MKKPAIKSTAKKATKRLLGQIRPEPFSGEYGFKFPNKLRGEIEETLSRDKAISEPANLLSQLELLVFAFRQWKRVEPPRIPSADRAELIALGKLIEKCVNVFDEGGLSPYAWERLTTPLMESQLRVLIPSRKKLGEFPPPLPWQEFRLHIYLFHNALFHAVQKAAEPKELERLAGRPKDVRKKSMVVMAVKAYKAKTGKLPPTTKDSPFEEALAHCLAAVPFPKVGNLPELIREARLVVRQGSPPKPPA